MRLITVAWGLLAPLLASACAPPIATLPPAPAQMAEKTTVDDRTALAVEVLYQEAGALLEAAIDGGRLKGEAAERADAIDAEAASYVQMARAAYDASNAQSYAEAIKKASPLLKELIRLASQRP